MEFSKIWLWILCVECLCIEKGDKKQTTKNLLGKYIVNVFKHPLRISKKKKQIHKYKITYFVFSIACLVRWGYKKLFRNWYNLNLNNHFK